MRNVKLWSAVLVLIAGSIFVVDSSLLAQRGGGNMPAGVQQSKLPDGTMILADAKGMTLYTFAKDQPGVSNCNDNCAKNWPPLMAASDAKADGAYSIIDRKDGTKQWAKDGMPLYYWVKDTKMGDITGDGVGGNWDLAKP